MSSPLNNTPPTPTQPIPTASTTTPVDLVSTVSYVMGTDAVEGQNDGSVLEPKDDSESEAQTETEAETKDDVCHTYIFVP